MLMPTIDVYYSPDRGRKPPATAETSQTAHSLGSARPVKSYTGQMSKLKDGRKSRPTSDRPSESLNRDSMSTQEPSRMRKVPKQQHCQDTSGKPKRLARAIPSSGQSMPKLRHTNLDPTDACCASRKRPLSPSGPLKNY